MPFGSTMEPKLLDQLLGANVAQINQSVASGTASTSSLTIRGSAGSGSADHTPVVGEVWVAVTPGAAGSENQYANWEVYQVSGSPTGTSLTFASRTTTSTRAVGDLCFILNTTAGISAFGNVPLLGKVFIGLSTAGAQATIAAGSDTNTLPQGTVNITQTSGTFPASGNVIIVTEAGEQNVAYTGLTGSNPTVTALTGCTGGTAKIDTGDTVYLVPSQATLLSNEPTSTGSYARSSQTNNAANFPASTSTYPASKSSGATFSFAASTAAWSSGATALVTFFIADSSTLAGGNIIAWGYLTTPQAVNASGITLSFGSGSLGPITLL